MYKTLTTIANVFISHLPALVDVLEMAFKVLKNFNKINLQTIYLHIHKYC